MTGDDRRKVIQGLVRTGDQWVTINKKAEQHRNATIGVTFAEKTFQGFLALLIVVKHSGAFLHDVQIGNL